MGGMGETQKPLTDLGLAKLLRPYGIQSGTVRGDNDVTGKGYYSGPLRTLSPVISPSRGFNPSHRHKP